MKRTLILIAVAGIAAAWSPSQSASAFDYYASQRNMAYSWNAGYYDPAWGAPVALVVPPNVHLQTNWGWGVGNTRVTPIYNQFQRQWPGPAYYNPAMYRPTPPWPSDTTQFGDYYIRGPRR
jgi:hypothetical protein